MVKIDRIHKLDNGSAIKAFADVILLDVVKIKGVRVVKGKNGLFAAMPRTQAKDGNWYEPVSLVNDKMREKLQNAVLKAYKA
jgi:DNA-binding cell septation regulator SpoVG